MDQNNLKKLVADGKLEQALDKLLSFAEEKELTDVYNQSLSIYGRLKEFKKNQIAGVLSSENANVESSKLRMSILALIDQLKDPNHPQVKSPTVNDRKRYAWLLIPILGLAFLIFYWPNISGSSTEETKELDLVVFVHGTKGPMDLISDREGTIMVDIGEDRRSAQIGENGRTVFSSLPLNYVGESVPISVKMKGYEQVDPEFLHKLTDEAIYIELKPASILKKIEGIVKDSESGSGLVQVQILLDNKHLIQSDEIGRFSLELNEEDIKSKYTISFSKEGYINKTLEYYPGQSSEFRLQKK